MQKQGIISPLINYMTEKNMLDDFSAPVSESVTSEVISFTASGGGLPTSLAINTPYYFQPNNLLDSRNSKIKAIEVVSTSFQTLFENGASNVSSDDVFSKFLLYIVDGEDNILVVTPLSSLLGVAYGGFARKLYQVDFEDIIWQKCYIEILDTTGISAGQGVKLNIYYDKKLTVTE